MIDLHLLRILRCRDDFYKIHGRIPTSALNATTVTIISDFGKYFETFPNHDWVDISTFLPLFNTWHPTLNAETRASYNTLFKKMGKKIDDATRDGILENMLELRLASSVADLLAKFDAGDAQNFYAEIDGLFTEHKRDARITGIDWVRDDIGGLLAKDDRDDGLHWRLDVLNTHMRPVRGGDFIVVGGRPNKGKTTFLSCEVTYMAPQIEEGQTILWLNNEGPGNRIKQRLYQSAVGLRLSEMIVEHKAGRLVPAYVKAVGEMDRIRVFDIHGMDTFGVERIIEKNNPALVIYDMIDKVRGFKMEARNDLSLEAMYDWARELSVKYDFVGMATSQISVEGDGLLFPTMPMLKDSKTGKQGSCDVQIMIGASNDPGMQSVRGIGLVKNKLHREGTDEDPRATVAYRPQIARYEDAPIEMEESTDD